MPWLGGKHLTQYGVPIKEPFMIPSYWSQVVLLFCRSSVGCLSYEGVPSLNTQLQLHLNPPVQHLALVLGLHTACQALLCSCSPLWGNSLGPVQSHLPTRLLLASRRRLWTPMTWLPCALGLKAAMSASDVGVPALSAALPVLHLLVSLPACWVQWGSLDHNRACYLCHVTLTSTIKDITPRNPNCTRLGTITELDHEISGGQLVLSWL